MEAMESKAESADDITAAAMAAVPVMEMKDGVRWCRTIGRTILPSPRSSGDGEP